MAMRSSFPDCLSSLINYNLSYVVRQWTSHDLGQGNSLYPLVISIGQPMSKSTEQDFSSLNYRKNLEIQLTHASTRSIRLGIFLNQYMDKAIV